MRLPDRMVMAADSQATDAVSTSSVPKVYVLGRPARALVGVAGLYTAAVAFVRWLRGQGEPPNPEAMAEVSAIVARDDGSLWYYEGSLEPFRVHDAMGAIGSGAQGALVAMRLGLGPADAVRAVRRVDPHTGGRVIEKSIPRKNARKDRD